MEPCRPRRSRSRTPAAPTCPPARTPAPATESCRGTTARALHVHRRVAGLARRDVTDPKKRRSTAAEQRRKNWNSKRRSWRRCALVMPRSKGTGCRRPAARSSRATASRPAAGDAGQLLDDAAAPRACSVRPINDALEQPPVGVVADEAVRRPPRSCRPRASSRRRRRRHRGSRPCRRRWRRRA